MVPVAEVVAGSEVRSNDPGQGTPRRHRVSVSIVTVVRNRAASLARTIDSVLGQTYPEVEHVVIDGASTDGTVAVIRRYADRLAYWISEPDRGISDAFNKGVAVARGDCIGLLNADDWLEPEQIRHAVAALRRSGSDFVFGDLLYHDAAGRTLFRIRGDKNYARAIERGMPDVNHPTLLAWRRVYEQIGAFDPSLRFAMDYDWLLRAHRAGFRGTYAPEMVGHMTLAGVSDRDYIQALGEVRDIAIAHGEPRARAWPLYLYRVTKGTAQRVLQRSAPPRLYEAVRGRVNPSYEPHRPSGRR
jgi:glycosyltransferase involved in cell wall biosynthesis